MHFDFRYADLLNDEVFKLVFGQESTKDVMIEFLNQVIPDRTIVDVEYMDKEMHPQEIERKTSVYDLFCMTDDGSRVIVELQKRKQDSYVERMLYYSMHQILKQIDAGESSFDFYPVYVISIMDFKIMQNDALHDVRTVYRLLEVGHHMQLTDKVTYIFIELPKFRKSVEELDGDVLEGMYFCLKNMPTLQDKPEALTHDVFDKIFSITEFLNMDEETRAKIRKNMTTERDFKNQLAYARKEGREQGREEERRMSASKFKALGVDVEIISQATGLSIEDIALL